MDPNKRLSATQALQHDWITGGMEEDKLPDLSNTRAKLRKKESRHHFRVRPCLQSPAHCPAKSGSCTYKYTCKLLTSLHTVRETSALCRHMHSLQAPVSLHAVCRTWLLRAGCSLQASIWMAFCLLVSLRGQESSGKVSLNGTIDC